MLKKGMWGCCTLHFLPKPSVNHKACQKSLGLSAIIWLVGDHLISWQSFGFSSGHPGGEGGPPIISELPNVMHDSQVVAQMKQ